MPRSRRSRRTWRPKRCSTRLMRGRNTVEATTAGCPGDVQGTSSRKASREFLRLSYSQLVGVTISRPVQPFVVGPTHDTIARPMRKPTPLLMPDFARTSSILFTCYTKDFQNVRLIFICPKPNHDLQFLLIPTLVPKLWILHDVMRPTPEYLLRLLESPDV